MRAPDGRLLFATYDGVSVIDPRRIPFNHLPPPVHVERVVADGTTYTPGRGDGLRLPPFVRNLRIEFTALSLAVPEKVRFRYKLEGRDEEWVDVSNRREAFYTDLPPKRYRFRVIATNNDGVWNTEGAVLAFSIQPSFYQTRTLPDWRRPARRREPVGALSRPSAPHRRAVAGALRRTPDRAGARRAGPARHAAARVHQHGDAARYDHRGGRDDRPTRTKLERLLGRMRDVIDEGRDAVQGLRTKPGLDDLEQALVRGAEELRGSQAVEIRDGRDRPASVAASAGARRDLAHRTRSARQRVPPCGRHAASRSSWSTRRTTSD